MVSINSTSDYGQALIDGHVREVFSYLRRQWPKEQGERVIADIGNDKQNWEYNVYIKNRDVPQRYNGWRQVLDASALGFYKSSDGKLEAYVVMTQGGRNDLGDMDFVKYVVGIYDEKGNPIGEPVIIEDKHEVVMDGNKKNYNRIEVAQDKLLPFLKNMKVTKTVTEAVA